MSALMLAVDTVTSGPLDLGGIVSVVGLVAWLEVRVLPRWRWTEATLRAISAKVGATPAQEAAS